MWIKRCVCCLVWCMLVFMGCSVPDKALVLTSDDFDNNREMLEEEVTVTDVTAKGSEGNAQEAGQMAEVQMICVHVCGAVQCSGVVEVPLGSRVADALTAAGGLTEDAAEDYVNLAAKLEDAQQLYFPTREEAERLLQKELAETSSMVNINTANKEQLCTLPGIGAARATDIIAYREQHGGFQSKEDIMQVTGIKQNAYEKLQAYITVD